jgi:hypothetical protein
MNLTKFCFGAASSELMKNDIYEDSIFLTEKHDSAIMCVDYVTGSIIYSLRKLVYMAFEDLRNEDRPDGLEDRNDLYILVLDHFFKVFSDFQSNGDGIPPTLLYNVERDLKIF